MEIIDPSRLHFDAKTKDECKRDLIEARWHGQFRCPACGHKKGYWIKKRALYECANKNCKKQTSPTAGTQFHKTRNIEGLWIIMKELANDHVRDFEMSEIKTKTGMSYSGCRKLMKRMSSYHSSAFSRYLCSEKQIQFLFIRRSERQS